MTKSNNYLIKLVYIIFLRNYHQLTKADNNNKNPEMLVLKPTPSKWENPTYIGICTWNPTYIGICTWNPTYIGICTCNMRMCDKPT